MTGMVKGMLDAYDNKLEPRSDLSGFDREAAMRAALIWLSEHVTDEMVFASFRAGGIQVLSEHPEVIDKRRREIAAAIRAAAGEEGK